MTKTGLIVIDELDLEAASDDELVETFLLTAKEMGSRGRTVWEEFFKQLAADNSPDAAEAMEYFILEDE